MDLKLRITAVIKTKGLNVKSFAKTIKIPYATLVKQLGGERQVSLETINAIIESFPDVSAEWLLRGEGSILKGAEPMQKTDFIDIFLNGICHCNAEEIDGIQKVMASVTDLKRLQQ